MSNKKIDMYRPTRAEINLSNLEYNLNLVRRLAGRRVKIMATVKADAYGHGLIEIAKKLDKLKIDYLGVASIEEAISLRKAGIIRPVLILGLILPNQVTPLFDYNLAQTVCTIELAKAISTEATKRKKQALVHIKVDTGMGRLGIWHKQAFKFIQQVSRMRGITVEGIFTHFPSADTNLEFTLFQIDCFNRLIERLEDSKNYIPLKHSANSMGIIGYKESHFNLVRPGLMIYGLYPKKDMRLKLKPVLSLKSRIIYLNQVPKGRGISYGHTYITPRKTTVAVLPIGYGDGYPRILSNRSSVLIRGRRAPVVGRVCMDLTMVDAGKIPNLRVGDEAVLIGAQGKERITVEELADLAATIPYEIVTSLGSRIPRLYTD